MGDPRVLFSLIALIAVGSFVSSAQAGGLAVPGEVYATGYLDNPAGSLPGGDSGTSGEPANNEVSQDGRYVVFTSQANSLAPGANPDAPNVFRKDRQTGAVELASRATGANGVGGKGRSYEARISDDGNIVGFISRAGIDPSDADGGESDIYIRDIASGTTKLMTGGMAGDIYQFDLSGDGNYIAFGTPAALVGTDINSNPDIFRRKISDGSTALASRIIGSETAVNGSSFYPAISNNGRWVAFASTATNVIPGFIDSNSGSTDIFVRDMNGGVGSNQLISCKFNSAITGGNGASQEPDIAGTPGTASEVKVAYSSYATDTAPPGIDTTNDSSIFLKTLAGVSSSLLSISSLGVNADSRAHTPSISDDAAKVVFSSDATNLTPGAIYYGSYLRDITAGTTTLITNSTQYAVFGALSGNGKYVAWDEQGGFTPDSDPDSFGVFGRSLPGGAPEFISRPAGNQPFLKTAASVSSPSSRAHVLSADGRYLAFEGGSHRLPGAISDYSQIYRRDLLTGAVELLSRRTGPDGAFSTGSTSSPAISSDGNRVAFISYAPLSDDDTNTDGDIYVRDIANRTTTLVSRADGATGAVALNGAGTPVISADGNRVVFASSASNLGLGGGVSQIYVRDLVANTTIPASRADGAAGAAGSSNSLEPGISGDGNLVVFASAAANLSPDDLSVDRDIYVRNLAANTTTLVSRAPGLTGAKLAEYEYGQTISTDGSTVAFETPENIAVPGGTPWPVGPKQIVLRKLATGDNILASSAGGLPAETSASDASLNRDASVVAFQTDAPNLLPGLGAGDNDFVVVKRMGDGLLSGPPLFGDPEVNTQVGSRSPSISDNGQCLAFRATGYNAISGEASDISTSYLQVLSGTCFNPRAVVPELSKLSLKPKKFAVAKKATPKAAAVAGKKGKPKKSPKGTKIRFTLNRDADVSFTIEKRTIGRKVKGKCVKSTRKLHKKKKCVRWVPAGNLTRAAQAAGARTLFFSGRIGKKKLKPGRYRVALQATATSGTSPVSTRLPFTILRK